MSDQASDRQDRIRLRAYWLWQAAGSPEGGDLAFWAAAEREEAGGGDEVYRASEQSFPASDPPARSGITGPAGAAS